MTTATPLQPGDDSMDYAEFQALCRRYVADHLAIRNEALKSDMTLDTERAVYKMASWVAARSAPEATKKQQKKAKKQAKRPQEDDSVTLRHKIAQVLTKPMTASEIAKCLRTDDSQGICRCLSAEKSKESKWFIHLPDEQKWRRGKLAQRWLRNWKPKAKAKKVAARSRTDRTSLKEAIIAVMGDQKVDVGTVLAGVKKRGLKWKSQNERTDVNNLLIAHKDTFERVGHGVYRVRKVSNGSNGAAIV